VERHGKIRGKHPDFTTPYAQYLEKSGKESDFSTFPQNLYPPIIEMWKKDYTNQKKESFLLSSSEIDSQ